MNKMVLSIKSRIKYINRSQCIEKQSPNFLAPESGFMGENFSTNGGGAVGGAGGGGGFGMIQAHYIYCALYFYYYYYISSTSDHQVLYPGTPGTEHHSFEGFIGQIQLHKLTYPALPTK